MKNKLSILLAAILTVSFLAVGCSKKAAPTASNDAKDYVLDKGTFILGLDDSFPPMGFKDDKGEIVGFDIDLAKEAAKRMNLKVELKPVDWDGVVLSLKNKNIDVIWNGLTITDERQKQIDFSKPYLENKQIIVVGKNSIINSKKDLANKTVGLQLGSSSESALSNDSATASSIKEVKKYSNNTEALMDLSNGRIDAVVVDEIVGRYYISKKPDTYKILTEDFGKESFGVGIRKEDKAFREKLDKALDDMRADGTMKKISEKWFGSDITK